MRLEIATAFKMRCLFVLCAAAFFAGILLAQEGTIPGAPRKILPQPVLAIQRDTAVTPCTGNTASYVTSQSCSLGMVPANDRIICSTESGDNGVALKFSDNINGAYEMDLYGPSNGGYHEYLMTFSSPNTAAGPTTVTASFSISADATGFSCAAYKNAKAGPYLDPAFMGWNDYGPGTSTSYYLNSSSIPTNAGEMIFCALSSGSPATTVTSGARNYTIAGGNSTNSIYPEIWSQPGATAANCLYKLSPADSATESGLAYLSTASTGGIKPYQGMILTYSALMNGSVPTYTQLSQSVSGNVGGWFGPEVDWDSNTTFVVTNTHGDLLGSTSGPVNTLGATFYLPAIPQNTSGTTVSNSWLRYSGDSPMNLQFTTGTPGDSVKFNLASPASMMSFGYYIEWDIPNNDSSSHGYTVTALQTGNASNLYLNLSPTGTQMSVNMIGGVSSTTRTLGTGSAGTVYWVTGQWNTGGTLSESFYSGCPGSCTLVGSNTISDTSNNHNATAFLTGMHSGTNASGYHIWWRNVKFCSNATYPCLPPTL